MIDITPISIARLTLSIVLVTTATATAAVIEVSEVTGVAAVVLHAGIDGRGEQGHPKQLAVRRVDLCTYESRGVGLNLHLPNRVPDRLGASHNVICYKTCRVELVAPEDTQQTDELFVLVAVGDALLGRVQGTQSREVLGAPWDDLVVRLFAVADGAAIAAQRFQFGAIGAIIGYFIFHTNLTKHFRC